MCSYIELESIEQQTRKSFHEFSKIVGRMTYNDPERRLTVQEAMKSFYELLNNNLVDGVEVYGWDVVISSLVKNQIQSL